MPTDTKDVYRAVRRSALHKTHCGSAEGGQEDLPVGVTASFFKWQQPDLSPRPPGFFLAFFSMLELPTAEANAEPFMW